ncbi:unknown protein [Seminavis robusta]|uniref:Uncharacterized protein n=1 Tax=Seminavis robusta TaxID=568900 RepID=A0A9N8H2M3_9STRA|nr:unknown protein [Seminavis robusta]|eukprot:Sro39_g024350.1 n/a (557) ;mRNA; r:144778-146448
MRVDPQTQLNEQNSFRPVNDGGISNKQSASAPAEDNADQPRTEDNSQEKQPSVPSPAKKASEAEAPPSLSKLPNGYMWKQAAQLVDYDEIVNIDESQPGHLDRVIEFLLSKNPADITDNENHLLNLYIGTKGPGGVTPNTWVAVPKEGGTPTKSPPKKRRDTRKTPEFCRSSNGNRQGVENPHNKEAPVGRTNQEAIEVDSDTESDSGLCNEELNKKTKVRFSAGSTADDAIEVDDDSEGTDDTEEGDKKPPALKGTAQMPKANESNRRKPTPFVPRKKPPPVASIPLPDSSSDSDSDPSDDSTDEEESYHRLSKKTVQRKRRTSKKTQKKGTAKGTKNTKGKKKKKRRYPDKWKARKARAKVRHEERKEERKKKRAEEKGDEEVNDPITPPQSDAKPKYWRNSAEWAHDAMLRNWKSAATTYSRMQGFPGAKAIQTVLETTADENGKSQLRGYRVPSPTLAPADKASRDAIVKAATTVILKLAKASIIRMFRDDPSLIYYFVDVSAGVARNTDRPPSPVHNAIAATMGAIMDMFDPDQEKKEGDEKSDGRGGKKK